ncbi:MAG: alpha/beta fold hydrolase [Solirubrobacterales bacterium]|nr:alpha/beta fold hydrolase [Solirubrobacterales bacterium]
MVAAALRPLARLAAGAAGLLVALYGLAPHVPHAVQRGPSLEDVAWIAAGIGGLVVLAIAVHGALRGRTWRAWLVAVPVALLTLQFVVLPAVLAGLVVNADDAASPPAASLRLPDAHDVTVRARDGVRLAGWYVPGRRDAGVVVLHGSHGTRADALEHVRMLAGAGFAVLAIDARGHGQSGGDANALGWAGADDVAGAVAAMRAMGIRDVAALGLSMGAEEALRAAASGVPLRAVVADGAGGSTTADQRLVSSGAEVGVTWAAMRATELLSGDDEPAPLRDVAAHIRAPVLLVASGARHEHDYAEAYRERIGARAAVWDVPDAGHTEALREHPAAYGMRVEAFLERALRR